ncbi:MAG: FtsQ-type POTRA domain-containing protein, partial [Proteobacteria bacterium]|nr:FtsQ-type POTRA domain-containing protein [Pseudomonadota bacterium]
MPAAVRGGSRARAGSSSKTPPQASSKGASSKGAASRAAAPRGPVRRAPAAEAHGLSPKLALAGAAAVLALALGVTLATGQRGERLVAAIGSGIDNRFGAAGFRLRTIEVQGASAMATADIVRAAGVYKDQPMLGLDLDALRGRVEQVGWVKTAHVVRLLPDTLVISVVEHRQLAVWQHAGRQVVIDDHGQVIREADPARFTRLPLVVGEG